MNEKDTGIFIDVKVTGLAQLIQKLQDAKELAEALQTSLETVSASAIELNVELSPQISGESCTCQPPRSARGEM